MAYLAGRLRELGIEIDRAWLEASPSEPLAWLSHGNDRKMIEEARNRIPESHAHWELGPFFEYTIAPAVYDLFNGPFESFEEFAFLYERLLGERAKPWLPSLFLAAAASPSLATEARQRLVQSFDPSTLDTDEF